MGLGHLWGSPQQQPENPNPLGGLFDPSGRMPPVGVAGPPRMPPTMGNTPAMSVEELERQMMKASEGARTKEDLDSSQVGPGPESGDSK